MKYLKLSFDKLKIKYKIPEPVTKEKYKYKLKPIYCLKTNNIIGYKHIKAKKIAKIFKFSFLKKHISKIIKYKIQLSFILLTSIFCNIIMKHGKNNKIFLIYFSFFNNTLPPNSKYSKDINLDYLLHLS